MKAAPRSVAPTSSKGPCRAERQAAHGPAPRRCRPCWSCSGLRLHLLGWSRRSWAQWIDPRLEATVLAGAHGEGRLRLGAELGGGLAVRLWPSAVHPLLVVGARWTTGTGQRSEWVAVVGLELRRSWP